MPKHNPGGGQWTREGGAGIGHNQGPPLEPPPVPPEKPRTAQARNTFIKAAQWLARAARMGTPIGGFLAALDAASWLDTDRPYIEAFRDPPKSLEELQDAVSRPARGYHVHHIVEQTPAGQDGFPRDLIDGRDNLVRIPALKHWQITGWYATRNKDFGGMTPRDYLRGRSWRERMRVGLRALRLHGVLAP